MGRRSSCDGCTGGWFQACSCSAVARANAVPEGVSGTSGSAMLKEGRSVHDVLIGHHRTR